MAPHEEPTQRPKIPPWERPPAMPSTIDLDIGTFLRKVDEELEQRVKADPDALLKIGISKRQANSTAFAVAAKRIPPLCPSPHLDSRVSRHHLKLQSRHSLTTF